MLSGLDETLMHQGPLPFSQALLSDHRFYDRYVLSGFRRDGQAGIVTGMGVYKNLNVMDGYALTQFGASRQRNMRFSRPLHPIREPLQARAAAHGVSGAVQDPALHLRAERARGQLRSDLPRISRCPFGEPSFRPGRRACAHRLLALQSGGLARRHGANRWSLACGRKWFSWRDHSWGVRPGVGGFEPFTGTRAGGGLPSSIRAGGRGILVMYLGFATDHYGGMIQLQEDEDGKRLYIDGRIGASDSAPSEVVDVQHEFNFIPGTRLFDRMKLQVTTGDGAAGTSRWSRSDEHGSSRAPDMTAGSMTSAGWACGGATP